MTFLKLLLRFFVVFLCVSAQNDSENITTSVLNTITEIHTEKNLEDVVKAGGLPEWYHEAIKDIAYYLRSYKFNEYDRRYETKPELAPREYFRAYPRPPLRSLHWEVRKYCESSFLECVDYLRKKIRYAASKRADDTSLVILEQHWNASNVDQIKQVDEECRKMKRLDEETGKPFAGPLERFQWRTTASYYMCWYTLNEVPDLNHFNESCDNFANCLDTNFGPNNFDSRANDSTPFACAMYSFCPDPCCPQRHLQHRENCWNAPENPCFHANPHGQRKCRFDRARNVEFRDIVLNRWNVSCGCSSAGYVWDSLYGMCVDVDECIEDGHRCDSRTESCVNLPGKFRCVCRWGHVWHDGRCTPSAALDRIKLQRHRDVNVEADVNGTRRAIKYLLYKVMRLYGGSGAASVPSGSRIHFEIAVAVSFLW